MEQQTLMIGAMVLIIIGTIFAYMFTILITKEQFLKTTRLIKKKMNIFLFYILNKNVFSTKF